MRWIDDHTLDLGDVSFDLDLGPGMRTKESTEKTFVLLKERGMIERMVARLGGRPIRALVELGIYKGGSVVLYQRLFQPRRLVAVERHPPPVAALADYLARRELGDVVRPCYGVDQADRRGMEAVLAREVGDLPIDVVVDDASHHLQETRASFNLLYPRLEPGGFYIIEDWGWAHWPGEPWQTGGGHFAGRPALTNLIFEIVMTSASRPEVIAEVIIDSATIYVRRGPAQLDATFDIRRAYFARGRLWTPL